MFLYLDDRFFEDHFEGHIHMDPHGLLFTHCDLYLFIFTEVKIRNMVAQQLRFCLFASNGTLFFVLYTPKWKAKIQEWML